MAVADTISTVVSVKLMKCIAHCQKKHQKVTPGQTLPRQGSVELKTEHKTMIVQFIFFELGHNQQQEMDKQENDSPSSEVTQQWVSEQIKLSIE